MVITLISQPHKPFFSSSEERADLYGPFWIVTTLVVMLAITGLVRVLGVVGFLGVVGALGVVGVLEVVATLSVILAITG